MKTEAGDIDFVEAPYNNHGAFLTCPSSPAVPIHNTAPVVAQHRTAAAIGAQPTNIPHAGDGAFCGRADVVATAAIAPAIGSNPANTQTPETPHEVHLYETERAPHRR